MTDGINKAIELMTQDGDEWEPGDQDYIVCNDGIVILELDDSHNIKVNVIAGKPRFENINLGLIEE